MRRLPLLIAPWLVLLVAAGCTAATPLRQGDCFDGGEGESVATVEARDCGAAHDREVYAVIQYPNGDQFPGVDTLNAYAEEQCLPSFETFVGRSYEESELEALYLTPSAETWRAGDRAIVCALYREGEKLTGSMKGTGR